MTKREKLIELMKNEYFKELIIIDYLDDGTKQIVFNENLNSQEIIDELKARQKLKIYLDIILTNTDKEN